MNDPILMKGKTCLVTGSTSGHGLAVACALGAMGADLIVHGPDTASCKAAGEHVESVTGKIPRAIACDFSSRAEIDRAAKELLSWNLPIHVLVNNAGMVNRKRVLSADGIEMTFAVNYLAMFQFTLLILPGIISAAPARIVNVGSDAHMIGSLDLDDLDGSKKRYSVMGSYGRSKLAVAYFTVELARRLAGTGVTVNAVDPGPMATNIAKKPGIIPHIADAIMRLTFPPPARAARTAIHLASSPDVEGVTGKYFRFMKAKEPKLSSGGADFGERLWEASARLTGADF